MTPSDCSLSLSLSPSPPLSICGDATMRKGSRGPGRDARRSQDDAASCRRCRNSGGILISAGWEFFLLRGGRWGIVDGAAEAGTKGCRSAECRVHSAVHRTYSIQYSRGSSYVLYAISLYPVSGAVVLCMCPCQLNGTDLVYSAVRIVRRIY